MTTVTVLLMLTSLVLVSFVHWLFGGKKRSTSDDAKIITKLTMTDRVAAAPTASSSLLPNVTTAWAENGYVYRVYYAREPFAKGVCKLAYEGWIVGDGPRYVRGDEVFDYLIVSELEVVSSSRHVNRRNDGFPIRH